MDGSYRNGSNGPGVVVLQEWWGLNDQIRRTADRVAAEGFRVLAPDLYHGRVTSSPDEAAKLLMALEIGTAAADIASALRALEQETVAPVGVMGFCMGGALSLYAACTNGDRVGACVVYYGGHRKVQFPLDGLRAPVLAHWAEHDESVNARVPALREGLEERGLAHEFHTYPGTKHAFFNEDRPAAYDRDAAELSFRRTIAFFRAHLAKGDR